MPILHIVIDTNVMVAGLRSRRGSLQVPRSVVEDVLDFHCAVAIRHQIFFLWRPYLPDPSDDMILDTYNTRDFVSVERFALRVIEPGAFLQHIGALP